MQKGCFKMQEKGIKIVGLDLALNHIGAVELTDGEMSNFWYVTDILGSANKSKLHGTRLVLPKTKERQVKSIARLAWLEHWIDKTVLMASGPKYVGIEDYAIRAEQGAHYMGEIGGICRILCWFRGLRYRLHDPVSVKMFTAHDGTCQKDGIERAVKERWNVDFSEFNPPPPKPNKRNANPKQNRTTSEDLCDAYAIAQMVWTEVQLRSGQILMQDLHPKEVQVFNRVTKTYPVSLLDREWIHNPEGVDTPHGKPVCPSCHSTTCCLVGMPKPVTEVIQKAIEKVRKRNAKDAQNIS
jgi:Holliday junction resolvasome RuvABC endonuclease subunit